MFWWFYIIAVLLIVPYILWIGWFYYGWVKTATWSSRTDYEKPGISVIIAARDEEENISGLLRSLARQNYPRNLLDVIIIDDNSSDLTHEIASQFINKHINFRYLKLPEGLHGKKAAIRLGVSYARFSSILLTDADCRVSAEWVGTIADCLVHSGADLIAGPVLLNGDESLLSKFQQLEHISLQGSAAGAIRTGNPVMCSSANLAFKKEAYLEADDPARDKISSGDDVFLLLTLHKKGRKIIFLKSADACAESRVRGSLKGFFEQRGRWASKSLYYNTKASLFTAILVFTVNFLLLAFMIAGFFIPGFLLLAALMWVGKSLVDFPFLYSITGYFRKRRLMFYFPLMQILYPFYVNYTAVASFSGDIYWKGRKVGK